MPNANLTKKGFEEVEKKQIKPPWAEPIVLVVGLILTLIGMFTNLFNVGRVGVVVALIGLLALITAIPLLYLKRKARMIALYIGIALLVIALVWAIVATQFAVGTAPVLLMYPGAGIAFSALARMFSSMAQEEEETAKKSAKADATAA